LPAQPAPHRGLLPYPYLDRGLTQRLGQISDLGLQLLLPRRRPRLPRDQALLASLEELRLPPTKRLLRNLLPSCGLGDRDLTGQHAQHDPQLLLSRDHRWSTHRGLVSLPCSEDQLRSEERRVGKEGKSLGSR